MNMQKQKEFSMGMWHRPFEQNLSEVKRTLQQCHDLGITDLFIETYFNGKLIYPSQISFTEQHTFVTNYDKYGSDLLLAFVEEGKLYDVNIHAWVENFFVGRYERIEDCFWYINHQDWLLKNRDQTYLQKNEVNYVFLDPANPDVKAYTLAIYKELMELHHVESLHLDYIRYPLVYDIVPPRIHDDVGYTDYALNTFKREMMIEGNIYQRLTEDEIYHQWCLFKSKIIDQFVHRVVDLAKGYHHKLSIAIFGDPNHAIQHKMQNWASWIDHAWIDIIIPMAYYHDSNRVYEEVKRLNKLINHRAIVYAGIAPAFMKLDEVEHDKQCQASYDAGAQGIIMFATQNYLSHHFMGTSNVSQELYDMLKKWKGKSYESID